jgi:glycerol-3-phosphate acyltransferase PlsY
MEMVIAALIGYLLGSIPFGLILTRLAGHGDIRTIGSGNIGATNVLRTGNKKLAIATLLLDALKGAVAILLVKFLMPDLSVMGACPPENPCLGFTPSQIFICTLVTALFSLLGHMFPVWLKFKGGKGVATGLGVLLALSWQVGLAVAATWLLVAFLFRISSLAALVAVSLSPLFAWFIADNKNLALFCATAAVLIVFKHHQNIKRLLKGEEPKIGTKKNLLPPGEGGEQREPGEGR